MKILIVEDNEDSRNLLLKQLRAYGHELTAAADGAEALEQALAQPPDIIVSDILMPKMDGYQLCRECKRSKQLKNIPFVFYTATYTREEDEKFALSLGADAFFIKPTEPDTFVQMLFEIVEKATSGLQPSAKVAPLEPSLLDEYSKRIFTKLEDKVAQLEREVTQRKEAEAALKESESKLSSILSSMVDLVFVLDKDGRFTSLYVPSEELYVSPEEFVWKTYSEVMPPHVSKLIVEAFDKNKRGEIAEFEYWLEISGKTEWYSAKLSPMLLEGEFEGCVAVSRNISERKRAEEALRKQTHDLGERVKELGCLYGISAISERKDFTLHKLYQEVINMLSSGWQHPEIACAGITIDGKSYKTKNYRETPWKQFSDIKVHGEKVGVVQVGYLEEKPELDEGPFLKEERSLIDAVAEQLARIIERKQAEEELRKHREHLEELIKVRTTQLEASNKELESFSYSVSHDLRAPLRSMDGFSKMLLEDYSDKLDEQGKDYLQRVHAAVQRMGMLIDDLLSLSRVTRGEMKCELVDLSSLTSSIAAELQKSQPKRHVESIIAPGVTANGDAGLLQILLENLLGNAWKFTGKHPKAIIEFGVTQVGGEEVFFVRDDGAGFDMTHADKLFGVFQRLHAGDEFSGTGVGLATVQRIVNHHGGRVWAKGEVEKGATFYFTL